MEHTADLFVLAVPCWFWSCYCHCVSINYLFTNACQKWMPILKTTTIWLHWISCCIKIFFTNEHLAPENFEEGENHWHRMEQYAVRKVLPFPLGKHYCTQYFPSNIPLKWYETKKRSCHGATGRQTTGVLSWLYRILFCLFKTFESHLSLEEKSI